MKQISTHAHRLLRVALASVFFYHGATKFPGAEDLAQTMGIPVARVIVLGLVEIVGAFIEFRLVLIARLGSIFLNRERQKPLAVRLKPDRKRTVQ